MLMVVWVSLNGGGVDFGPACDGLVILYIFIGNLMNYLGLKIITYFIINRRIGTVKLCIGKAQKTHCSSTD
jgi:hypothetical protein